MKTSLAIAALLGSVSAQLPITPCSSNEDCFGEANGNDFCCVDFTVVRIDDIDGDYVWGAVEQNFGKVPEPGDVLSICSSEAYHEEHETRTRGTDGVVNNVDDLGNVYENFGGFKEAVSDFGVNDFDTFLTDIFGSNVETQSAFHIRPECKDGIKYFDAAYELTVGVLASAAVISSMI